MKTRPASAKKTIASRNPAPAHGVSAKTRKMLINGQWVAAASGETFPTIDPATGEVICRVPAGDKADIDAAVKAARAAKHAPLASEVTSKRSLPSEYRR